MLLEHTVGNLDPLYIVSLVPDGLERPRYVTIKIYFVEISRPYKKNHLVEDHVTRIDLPGRLVGLS
jgi:hypothetical protein